jgi:type IV pilus assembly protein PilV
MRTFMHSHSTRHCVGGFSLVESMVALVVLSIGMLGIAALHVESLRSGRTALTRTTAVTLAADMADRIRANRTATKADYEAVVTSADTDAKCLPGGAGCTPAELARHDKAVWLGAISGRVVGGVTIPGLLPGGTGTVGCDDTTTPRTFTITITWSEVNATAPSTYTLTITA